MNLGKQKQLAARALGVSPKRIKLNATDAQSTKQVKELISREGVRELVEEKIVIKKPKKGTSRTHANHIAEQKKKGRRQGHGSRKGTAKARLNTKTKWVTKIRGLRAQLQKLRTEGRLEGKVFRSLYLKSKGNFFRNKRHLMLYIDQNKLLLEKETKEEKK